MTTLAPPNTQDTKAQEMLEIGGNLKQNHLPVGDKEEKGEVMIFSRVYPKGTKDTNQTCHLW